jgi:hypothetical protein
MVLAEVQILHALLTFLNTNYFSGDALSFVKVIACLIERNAGSKHREGNNNAIRIRGTRFIRKFYLSGKATELKELKKLKPFPKMKIGVVFGGAGVSPAHLRGVRRY